MFIFSEKFGVSSAAKFKKICGVYKIGFIGTDDFYIGSSISIGERINNHVSTLKTKRQKSIILVNAFNKYGKENMYFQVFVECEPSERLSIEQFCIDELNPRYNTAKSVSSPMTTKFSDKDILDIREQYCNRKYQEDVIKLAEKYQISVDYLKHLIFYKNVLNPQWLEDLLKNTKKVIMQRRSDINSGIMGYAPKYDIRKLNREQVGMIRWAIVNKKSVTHLCKILGIKDSSKRIENGIIYKEFTELVDASHLNLEDAQLQKLKNSDIPKIRWAHSQGIPHKTIAAVFGCHYNTSCDIKMNRSYKEITELEPCEHLFTRCTN